MATAILRPTSTDANAWSIGNHADIDNEVTQPATNADDWIAALSASADDNDVIVLGFGTIGSIDEVTNITVWSLGVYIGSTPEVDVNMGGWQGYQEVALGPPPAPGIWASDSFDGSWSQSDLNGLQVRYRADVPIKDGSNTIYISYVVVTYTTGPPAGWSHKIQGIANTNIAKISGVLKVNIAKVNGV